MKKKVLLLLAVCLLIANPILAKEGLLSKQKVKIDGQYADIIAYNIDDYNYFKLRDLANALKNTGAKFAVDYDGVTNQVLIRKNEVYQAGGDKNYGAEKKVQASISRQGVLVDGQAANMQAYMINDNNYFKLRDIGKEIGFYVGYDSVNNEVIIDTSKAYEEEVKQENPQPIPQAPSGQSYDPTLANLSYEVCQYISKEGGYVNLPKGTLAIVKGDVIQSLKEVTGKTEIPAGTYGIYEKGSSYSDVDMAYVPGDTVVAIYTSPSLDAPNSMRGNIEERYILGIGISGDETFEIFPDEMWTNLGDPNSVFRLDIVEPKKVFDIVGKGKKVTFDYWPMATILEKFNTPELKKEAMIHYALNALGQPYSAVDCSGLVMASMDWSGIDPGIPFFVSDTIPYSESLYEIPIKDIKRGDILNKTNPNGHAMIYLGDGKVVESIPSKGVIVANVRTEGYKAYRITDEALKPQY